MAFPTGFEILIIAGILVVLFIWGPGQIPKIARSIGLARRELEEAKKEATGSPN